MELLANVLSIQNETTEKLEDDFDDIANRKPIAPKAKRLIGSIAALSGAGGGGGGGGAATTKGGKKKEKEKKKGDDEVPSIYDRQEARHSLFKKFYKKK